MRATTLSLGDAIFLSDGSVLAKAFSGVADRSEGKPTTYLFDVPDPGRARIVFGTQHLLDEPFEMDGHYGFGLTPHDETGTKRGRMWSYLAKIDRNGSPATRLNHPETDFDVIGTPYHDNGRIIFTARASQAEYAQRRLNRSTTDRPRTLLTGAFEVLPDGSSRRLSIAPQFEDEVWEIAKGRAGFTHIYKVRNKGSNPYTYDVYGRTGDGREDVRLTHINMCAPAFAADESLKTFAMVVMPNPRGSRTEQIAIWRNNGVRILVLDLSRCPSTSHDQSRLQWQACS